MQTSHFVLQDSRQQVGNAVLFWAEGGGYTTNLDRAERFTLEEAARQHACRETDIPLPAAPLEALREQMVDHQYLYKKSPLHTQQDLQAFAPERRFIAVAPRQWDGNAVFFLTKAGTASPNVGKAQLLSQREAQALLATGRYEIWPEETIQTLAYWRVRGNRIDRKSLLKDSGVQLRKVRRMPESLYHCGGCGKFRSGAQYYGTRCSCGWSPHD